MALVANSVYAYTNLDDIQVFVGTDELRDRGDWSSAISYAINDAALYQGAYYVCLTANSNTAPDGNISDEWSTLALVRQGEAEVEYIVNGTRVIRDYHVAWGTNSNNNEVSADDVPYEGDYPNVQAAIDALFATTGTGGIQTVAQQGSAYAFSLYTQGTNFTSQQFTVAVQNGSEYSTILRDQGTNYSDAGDQVVGQQGSNYAFGLYVAGTNFASSLVSGASGSQFAVMLRDQGTNYTNSQIATEVINRNTADAIVEQHGSELSYNLYWQGTNFSLAQGGGATAIVAQQGSQYATILRDQGTNYTNTQISAEVASRIAGDAVVGQQGSNYSFGLYVAGTNYANSLVSGASGSQFAIILRDQGTNYTNSQVSIEAAARIAGDAVVAQQGSQYSTIVRDQGTNYTNSQVSIEASARASGDLQVAQNGSQLAYTLYWAGTATSGAAIQLSDAGVPDDGAGLATARVVNDLPIKRIKAGTNIAIENNGTNVKIGIDTLDTNQTSWVGPSIGQAGDTDYAGTIVLDFGSQAYSTVNLTGNLHIDLTGMQPGHGVSLRIIGDSVARTLSVAGGVRFIGTAPTELAADKIAIVSFSSYSTDLANVVGAYSAEQ
jgi:hypothetical protein